jgi:membrane-bound serine protease (ClpP class)
VHDCAVRYARLALLGTGLALMLMGPALGRATAAGHVPPIVSMRLDGVVDPFMADYIKGGIQAAQQEGASNVLLTMDTPGGLDSSMREIVQAISTSSIPVICYTSPEGARAASAGTFIMQSCTLAAMAPGTAIGAAHPVGVSGVIEQKKVTNDAVALITSLAETHHRNPSWAEKAVRDAISSSAQDALKLHVIELVEPTTSDLLHAADGMKAYNGAGKVVTVHTAGAALQARDLGVGASILHGLLSPDFAFIFFYLGLGLIVAGFLHHPVALIFGIISLVLSFVALGMLPVNLIGIVLLLASAGFFLLELKHPGLGLPAVAGVITLVLGALFLFNPHVPNAHVSWAVIAAVAIITTFFFVWVVGATMRARLLPRRTGREQLVGQEGVVTSDLTPTGVVQLGGERWSAKSSGGPLTIGMKVRVIGVDGLTLQVEPVMGRTKTVEGSVS